MTIHPEFHAKDAAMSAQKSFASFPCDTKRNVTRRETFLGEMACAIHWARIIALIAPHDPKAGRGRRPLPMETLLRVYLLQQWFNLSGPQAEDM